MTPLQPSSELFGFGNLGVSSISYIIYYYFYYYDSNDSNNR